MKNVMTREETSFLMIDVQERLLPTIDGHEAVTRNAVRLLNAAGIMSMPVLYTEQYPKGIGSTLGEVLSALPEGTSRFEKTSFSCFGEPEFPEVFKTFARSVTVVFGTETHICVLATIQDLLTRGFEVVLVADACGSRDRRNHDLALDTARSCGALVLSTETIVYQLLGRAGTPEFKAMLPIIK